MKPAKKTKGLALILLFLVMLSSCRKPDEGYNYEENDEPSTGLSQCNEKATTLATLEPFTDNERLLITKI